MTPAEPTHRSVVTKQDDGPWAEDVAHPELIDLDALDQAIAASFPASDPPALWAGADRARRAVRRRSMTLPVD